MNRILELQSNVGTVTVAWSSEGLLTGIDVRACSCCRGWRGTEKIPKNLVPFLDHFQKYLQGGEPLGAIPWELLDQSELTDFQLQVYRAISAIPHGETRTYSWVARRVGKPCATRAVGQALRKNPFPILVPCHRVVSTNTLGGFMGVVDPEQPEMQIKQRLINLESSYVSPFFSFLTDNLFAPSHNVVEACG